MLRMDKRGENSGDSVELSHFLTVTDPSAIMNHNGVPQLGDMLIVTEPYNGSSHPYVEIVEQPQQRGFRFRYECEGHSHGGLQGVNTESNTKVYPSIRVKNYDGPALIEVSLVTDEDPPRIHAHKLVGKNCVDGMCKVTINSTASIISFPNLCIQHVTKKKAAEVLLHRILEEEKLQKQMAGANLSCQPYISAMETVTAKKQAQDLARNMTLNSARLQFRVFLPNAQGHYLNMLSPVVSQPIYDSKSPGASALKICRMDKYGGCCTGNEEVFLLCEKVQKEDIQVRFVEQDIEGKVQWEAYGNFSPLDVHRQYAIVFKTPPYINPNIDRAVNVLIMLQRKSDNEVSEAKAFTYYPQNRDKDLIARKKRKKLPLDPAFTFGDGSFLGGAAGPSNGMEGSFGPLGPNLYGGDTGGAMDQNFSVILPNGNIVDQLNVLPQTVEQAVKEEFSNSHSEMPKVNDVYQMMHSTVGWSFDFNDLEMDAAHSIMHHSQLAAPARSATSTFRSKPVVSARKKGGHGGGCSRSSKEGSGDDDSKQMESSDDWSLKDSGGDIHIKDFGDGKQRKDSGDCKQRKNSSDCKQKKDYGDWKQKTVSAGVRHMKEAGDNKQRKKSDAEKNQTVKGTCRADRHGSALCRSEASDTGSQDTVEHSHWLMASKANSTLIERGPHIQRSITLVVDSQEAGQITETQHPCNFSSDAERGEGGGGGEHGNSSATRLNEVSTLELSVSEGGRTDEGFSEVSELSTGREEIPEPKMTSHILSPSPPPIKGKTESADVDDVTDKTVKAANAVVKRFVQRITAKTVLALRDYSETGDPRYLLLVQRHLTAIRNENGDLPLHLAVINNQTTALRHLLAVMMSLPDCRCVINTFNYIRQTALHLAAIMQQPVSIEMLLHAGADPALSDRNGNTPAHLAVLNNSLEGLCSLVKYLRPGVTAHNPFPELDYLNYDGYSPVHLAVQRGSVEMLRLLVRGQADVDLGDGKSGRTALHQAVELDDLPVAGFLLMEANADVNARCFDGNTPLHIACSKGLIGMVALLMTAGALTDVENEEIPSEEDCFREGEKEEGLVGRSPPVTQCRRGLQPRDYAAGKDRVRILRMLIGDFTTEEHCDTAVGPEYCNDPNLAVDPDLEERGREHAEDDLEQMVGGSVTHRSACYSWETAGISSQSESSPSVSAKLSQEQQAALSRILDPVNEGKDLLELARRLDYDCLVPALEVMPSSNSSPTMYLLGYNETYGSLARLRECLQDMGLDEALKVLDGRCEKR